MSGFFSLVLHFGYDSLALDAKAGGSFETVIAGAGTMCVRGTPYSALHICWVPWEGNEYHHCVDFAAYLTDVSTF